jgi:hypothetical protein
MISFRVSPKPNALSMKSVSGVIRTESDRKTVAVQLLRPDRLMLLILLLSCVLRVYLVLHGGSGYWPDELWRYNSSRQVVNFVFSGDIKHGLATLHSADHFLFKLIGVIPAIIEKAVSVDARIPGLFFCLFSVCNLWLIWRISLNLGASEHEALLSAFLLALSTSFFYYSRHLFPYDLAMTFGLLALLVAVRSPAKTKDSYLCGLLSSACFLSYNGYWTLVLFVMIMHTIWSRRGLAEIMSRAWRVGVGFVAPILSIVALSEVYVRYFVKGSSMLRQFIAFSRSVTQGTFSEGGTLPLEYLWHAEHFLLVLWLAAFAWSLLSAIKGTLTRQSGLGIAGVLFIYGLLFVTSVGLHKFVVYGRLARQLVPFFCLMTAHQLQRLSSNGVLKQALPVVCALAVLQAAFNFYIPLVQIFPANFRRTAEEITGTLGEGKKDLLFVQHIESIPENTSLPPHRVILRARHPLEFLPYQYEGYNPEQRRALRSTDISMRLIIYQERVPVMPTNGRPETSFGAHRD